MADLKRMRKNMPCLPPTEESDDDHDDTDDIDNGGRRGSKLSRAVKSKLAAKARRDQELVELLNLSEVLPFPVPDLKRLDKSSLIRLAITYIQVKTDLQRERQDGLCRGHSCKAVEGVSLLNGKSPIQIDSEGGTVTLWNSHNKGCAPAPHPVYQPHHQPVQQQQVKVEEGQMMLESMQGFLILINRRGRIMYVSDNVENYLGLKQMSLLGGAVVDIIHPADVKELGKQFTIRLEKSQPGDVISHRDPVSVSTGNLLQSDQKRMFYLRMRFNLSKDGCKTRHSGYMLVQWNGRLKLKVASSKSSGYSVDSLVCVCRPVQSHSILEIRLGGNMFMSRHNLDMKFTFCDPRILTLIGYEPSEVIGKTAYYFHNPLDASKVSDCHSKLIVKGSSVSKYYRFFGKNGDWVWMQTRATIIYNTCNNPQYVVCMNYVIGEDEGQRYLMMEAEQQGFRDPNVRGCIDLANNESPVSACSSGDESHDDAGYSSGYSHCAETNSPQMSGSGNMSSPDIHTVESSDERDSLLDDYPMLDENSSESLQKEMTASVDRVVTAMSNGLDPFLSSFQGDLGFPVPAAEDGIDLLDDLLKTMEDEQQAYPPTPPSEPTSTEVPSQPSFIPQGGKKQSLLRSLLDRGDSAPPLKTLKDYQYANGFMYNKMSPAPSKQIVTSVPCAPYTDSGVTTQANTVTNTPGKESESPMDVSQSDLSIPEDLLDLAVQYCESITDSQGMMPNLWPSAMEDLMLSETLAAAQPSQNTQSVSQNPMSVSQNAQSVSQNAQSVSQNPQSVSQNARSVSQSIQPSPNLVPVSNQSVSYIDLDKVSSIRKEHHYSSRAQCQGTGMRNNVPCASACAPPSCCSRAGSSRSSHPHSHIDTQHLKASRATATQTSICQPKSSSVSQYSPKCSRSPASRNVHKGHKANSSATSSQGSRPVSNGYPDDRSRSIVQLVSNKTHTLVNRSHQPAGSFVSNKGERIPAGTNMSRSFSSPLSIAPPKKQVPQSLQGMSELEKYLRGYVKEPQLPQMKPRSETISVSNMAGVSSSQTPFLQRLLTGELSRELYREIDSQMLVKERERRSSTSSLPSVSNVSS